MLREEEEEERLGGEGQADSGFPFGFSLSLLCHPYSGG